jgi:hypothetical protein
MGALHVPASTARGVCLAIRFTDSDAHTDTDPHANANADPHANADTHPNPHAHSDPHTHTKICRNDHGFQFEVKASGHWENSCRRG